MFNYLGVGEKSVGYCAPMGEGGRARHPTTAALRQVETQKRSHKRQANLTSVTTNTPKPISQGGLSDVAGGVRGVGEMVTGYLSIQPGKKQDVFSHRARSFVFSLEILF